LARLASGPSRTAGDRDSSVVTLDVAVAGVEAGVSVGRGTLVGGIGVAAATCD
jgi:hypothetical protein